MSMRKLTIGNKKLRGIPRKLRALSRWSRSFNNYFPAIDDADYLSGYWNVKIPVDMALVQGKQTSRGLQSLCAQALVDAAYNVFKEKEKEKDIRVTCSIVLPDMFASELFLFTSEEYFKEHTAEGVGRFGEIILLKNSSLIEYFDLNVPDEFSELGVLRVEKNDEGELYSSEHWYIGEVN